MPLFKSKKRPKNVPEIRFIIKTEKYVKDKKNNVSNYTLGQYNGDENIGRVFLPHIYEATKQSLNGNWTWDDMTERIIEKTCNTISHETLHKVVKDNLSSKEIYELPLPITAQEWAVRTLLEEKDFTNYLSYLVKDMSIKVGVDIMFSDYLQKRIDKQSIIIALYQIFVMFLIISLPNITLKIIFNLVYFGLVYYQITSLRKDWERWKKHRLQDPKPSPEDKQ